MDELLRILSLSLGISWASGLNLYATVAMLGILGSTGDIQLPEQLAGLQDSKVITAALIMFCIEFFADKIPIIDSIWDGIHSFIRIPVGAVLMSHAVGDVNPGVSWLAFIIGGMVSGAVHIGKAGTRILVNTSPEPYSNWFLSFTEDISVLGGLYTALHHPAIFLCFICLFFVLLGYLLPILWRAILGDFVGLRLKLKKKRGTMVESPLAPVLGVQVASRSVWATGGKRTTPPYRYPGKPSVPPKTGSSAAPAPTRSPLAGTAASAPQAAREPALEVPPGSAPAPVEAAASREAAPAAPPGAQSAVSVSALDAVIDLAAVSALPQENDSGSAHSTEVVSAAAGPLSELETSSDLPPSTFATPLENWETTELRREPESEAPLQSWETVDIRAGEQPIHEAAAEPKSPPKKATRKRQASSTPSVSAVPKKKKPKK